MRFKGCHCPHCSADLSEASSPQCPCCGRELDTETLYAKRRYPGVIILPAAVRRYGFPLVMIIAGFVVADGAWIAVGFMYLLLSIFFDPFD